MNTAANTTSPMTASTTSYGGVNMVDFRVVRFVSCSDSTRAKLRSRRTLAQANAWLLKNAAKVDAHAKASTKRLLGRDSV